MYYKQVIILITGNCNLECKYCYADGLKGNGSMSIENIKKAIELLDPYDSVLQISGGEPLLCPEEFIFTIKYAKETRPGSSIKLQTNATMINDKMAVFLKDNDINVNVSLDGISAINDEIRGNTKKTLNGIRILEENGVPVNITAVITSKNSDYLDKLMGIAILFQNVKSVSFDLLRKSGRANKNLDDLKADIDNIKKSIGKAYGLFNKFFLKEPKTIINDIMVLLSRSISKQKNPYYCYAAMGESVTIKPTGEVFSCPSLMNLKEGFLGDINDSCNFNKRIIRSVDNLKECRSCKIKYVCRGGCPVRAYLESENWLAVNKLECSYKMWLFNEFVEPLLHQK
ncbi:MAG: radical SAM protein [Actinobacteria bacterium]|nr:radical SAM protein [Actinomycetota bacterium]